MSLDQAQEQAVRAWLQAKHAAEECPACHATDWVILEIVDVPVRWPAELHSGGPSFPMVPIGCRNCGYVMLFSAAKLGLSTDLDDGEDGEA